MLDFVSNRPGVWHVSEIEFYSDNECSSDKKLQAKTFISSGESSDNPLSNAFDGDESTWWSNDKTVEDGPVWLGLSSYKEEIVRCVKLNQHNDVDKKASSVSVQAWSGDSWEYVATKVTSDSTDEIKVEISVQEMAKRGNPSWPNDFSFSDQLKDGSNCILLYVPRGINFWTPNEYTERHLCWKNNFKNPGIEWIANTFPNEMKSCLKIEEKFQLCVPLTSTLSFNIEDTADSIRCLESKFYEKNGETKYLCVNPSTTIGCNFSAGFQKFEDKGVEYFNYMNIKKEELSEERRIEYYAQECIKSPFCRAFDTNGNLKFGIPHLPHLTRRSLSDVSSAPTNNSTTYPSSVPTNNPTTYPSSVPINNPTTYPSSVPTNNPSTYPSSLPTNNPSTYPSSVPTNNPSTFPSSVPTEEGYSSKPTTKSVPGTDLYVKTNLEAFTDLKEVAKDEKIIYNGFEKENECEEFPPENLMKMKFKENEKKNSEGGDLFVTKQIPEDESVETIIDELALICILNDDCKGFNTAGEIKKDIREESDWVDSNTISLYTVVKNDGSRRLALDFNSIPSKEISKYDRLLQSNPYDPASNLKGIMEVAIEILGDGGLEFPYCFGKCESTGLNDDPNSFLKGSLDVKIPETCDGLKLEIYADQITIGNLGYLILEGTDDIFLTGDDYLGILGPFANFGMKNPKLELTAATDPLLHLKLTGSFLLPSAPPNSDNNALAIAAFDFMGGLQTFLDNLTLSLEATLTLEAATVIFTIKLGDPTKDPFRYELGNPNVALLSPKLALEFSMAVIGGVEIGVSLTVGIEICVSKCKPEDDSQRQTITIEGELRLEVGLPSVKVIVGGNLHMIGTWDVFGLGILHVRDVVVGTDIDLKFMLPTRVTFGGAMCVGSAIACDQKLYKRYIDVGMYMNLDLYAPEESGFLAFISETTLEHVLNIATDISGVEDITDFKDWLPDSVLKAGLKPNPPPDLVCPSNHGETQEDFEKFTNDQDPSNADQSGVFDERCYAFISISPLTEVVFDKFNPPVVIKQGIGFGGRLEFGDFYIAVRAQINIFDSSPTFFLEGGMSKITLGSFLHIGREWDEDKKEVVGDPYFLIDLRLNPVVVEVSISCTIHIPFLQSYAFVKIHIDKELFFFNAELSLFNGFFVVGANVEFYTDLSYFKAELQNIPFAGGLVTLKQIYFLIDTRPGTGAVDGKPSNGAVAAFKAKISVLFLLDFGIEWSLQVGQDFIDLKFLISTSIGGVFSVTLSGEARIEFNSSSNRRHSRALSLTGLGPIQSAEWRVAVDIELGEFLEKVFEAIGKFFENAWDGVKQIAGKIAEVAQEAWTALKAIGSAIGGAIKDMFNTLVNNISELSIDDLAGAVSKVGNLLYNAGKAIVGSLKNLGEAALEKLGEIANKAKEAVFEKLEEAKQWVQKLWGANSGEIKKTPRPDILDETWNCPSIDIYTKMCNFASFGCEKRCKNTFLGRICWPANCRLRCPAGQTLTGLSCCYFEKAKTIANEDCVEEKKKQVDNMKDDYEKAGAMYDCREETLQQNKGLEWASSADVKSFTNVEKPKTPIFENDGCQSLDFGIDVNKLNTNGEGVSNDPKVHTSVQTECVDFGNEDNIIRAINGTKNKIVDEAGETSKGNEMGSSGPKAQQCRALADLSCDRIPTATTNVLQDRMKEITCDEADGFKVEELFHSSTINLNYDRHICQGDPPTYHFELNHAKSDIDDKCDDREWYYDLHFKDCCGQESETLEFKVTVKQIPVEVVMREEDKIVTVACQQSIVPGNSSIPLPDVQGGCAHSSKTLNYVDTFHSFDSVTCETTIHRKYDISLEDCSELTQDSDQVIKITHSPPEFEDDEFPEDMTIDLFTPYGPDSTGFPKAFSPCGNGSVIIDYSDTVSEGDCIAETVIHREFNATDVCGQVTRRTQVR